MLCAERFHNAEAPLHKIDIFPLLYFIISNSWQKKIGGRREGAARGQKDLCLKSIGSREFRINDFLHAGAYE